MANGGRIGGRNVPGVDGRSGVWTMQEIAAARQAGLWWRDYDTEVLADSPVGYWKLDETSGTTAADSVGSANGTYTGGFTLNQSGIPSTKRPSVLLNGTSGYVDLGAPAALNLTSAWALEAWIYLTSTPSGCGIISEKYTGAGTILYELGFSVSTGTTGGPNLQVGFFDGTAWRVATGGPLALNTWHYTLGTWDGTTLKLHADDAQVATNTPGVSPSGSMDGVVVGRRHDTSGTPYFPGRIDEVAIYPTALSAGRALAHYRAGTVP